MRRLIKSIFGVTLLEVMLVLVIAAIIVVMSVRYYSSADAAQQATAAVQQLQAVAVAAVADMYAASKGSFDGLTDDVLMTLLPGNAGDGTVPPWGASRIGVSGGGNVLNIYLPNAPLEACGLIKANITANRRFRTSSECSTTTSTNLNFTYNRVGSGG